MYDVMLNRRSGKEEGTIRVGITPGNKEIWGRRRLIMFDRQEGRGGESKLKSAPSPNEYAINIIPHPETETPPRETPTSTRPRMKLSHEAGKGQDGGLM